MSLKLDESVALAPHAAADDDDDSLDVARRRDRLRLTVAAIRLALRGRCTGLDPHELRRRFLSNAAGEQQGKDVSHFDLQTSGSALQPGLSAVLPKTSST